MESNKAIKELQELQPIANLCILASNQLMAMADAINRGKVDFHLTDDLLVPISAFATAWTEPR